MATPLHIMKDINGFPTTGTLTGLVVPTGTVTLDTSELNPSPRIVFAGQTIQFLSPQADTYLIVTYYDVQNYN